MVRKKRLNINNVLDYLLAEDLNKLPKKYVKDCGEFFAYLDKNAIEKRKNVKGQNIFGLLNQLNEETKEDKENKT